MITEEDARPDLFWPRVHKTDSCWEWQGCRNAKQYGEVKIGGRKGRTMKAHRVAWSFANGPIPDGLCVLHHCDNPPCVRPDHLFLGTKADNNANLDERNTHIDPRGFRLCRACRRRRRRRREEKQRKKASGGNPELRTPGRHNTSVAVNSDGAPGGSNTRNEVNVR